MNDFQLKPGKTKRKTLLFTKEEPSFFSHNNKEISHKTLGKNIQKLILSILIS